MTLKQIYPQLTLANALQDVNGRFENLLDPLLSLAGKPASPSGTGQSLEITYFCSKGESLEFCDKNYNA